MRLSTLLTASELLNLRSAAPKKEGSENGLKMAIARAPDTQRENVKSVLISIESCTGAAAAAVAAGVAVSQRQRT